MRPVRTSRPRRGPRERTSSDPNRRIFRVLPAARPSATRWKMVSTIRRASAPVTPPWRLRTVAARSALFNVETRSVLPLITEGEDSGNCTAVGGGGRLQPGRRATAGGRCSAGSVARSAAKGVYQVAVRMTLNTGVPAERRTTTELRVLPCRPPAAGGAGRRAVPGLEGGAALTLAWRRVIGAGFALPRDAGLKTGAPGELPGAPVARASRGLAMHPLPGTRHWGDRRYAVARRFAQQRRPEVATGTRRWCGTYVGMAQGHRCWFRAPARCRSETGAPGELPGAPGELPSAPVARASRGLAMHPLPGTRHWGDRRYAVARRFAQRCRREALPGLEGGAALTAAWRRVIGAGFALPRDAGRRPALLSRAVRGAGSSVLVSRSRAMPVGDRRSCRAR